MKNMNKIVLLISLLFIGLNSIWSQGFTISGTQLLDAEGNNFIMKGLSIPLSWFVAEVNNNIGNIRENTGTNCLRIVVNTSTPDENWQTCVEKCIENNMIPMVELHDVTCGTDAGSLLNMANFWAGKSAFFKRPEIARYILINIANEWGDWAMANSNQSAWYNAYKPAITAIRNAGIVTTIVIDAPGCGQDIRNGETIRNYADDLLAHDPNHNLLFSVHMYCEWSETSTTSNILQGLPSIKNANIPIIVGEFGYQHDDNKGGICDINESTILNTCEANGIGWLAWSWKGNSSLVSYLDLSKDWAGTNLSDWGKTIVNGANGTKTAVTASVFGAAPIENNEASLLNIYPNPAYSGNFTIDIYGDKNEILKIYDLQDNLVFTQNINGEMDYIAPGLSPGMYILKVDEKIQKLVIE